MEGNFHVIFLFKKNCQEDKMKIVIAPDSFKESLSAEAFCNVVGREAAKIFESAEIIKLPVSDGGEGLVDSLLAVTGGERITAKVKGPLFEETEAEYGILEGGTAVIEMAAASGLPLVLEEKRNPMETTTYGTGELMRDALERGCREIILGIGGSATTDGGIGAAAALGAQFLDKEGCSVPLSGKGLEKIATVDFSAVDRQWQETKITIACDVVNPLCGPLGSAAIYGPQKGADTEMICLLDMGLNHFEGLIARQKGQEYRELPGIGAAGGLALPFVAFMGAELRPGLEIVLDVLEFDRHLQGADLVVTGEGRTDEQSAMGKVLCGVSGRARAQGVPAVALSGALEKGYEPLYGKGLTAAFSTWKSGEGLEWQMDHAEENLSNAARNLFRLVRAFC